MLAMPLGSQDKVSSGTLIVKQRRNAVCMAICTSLRLSPTQVTGRLSNSHWETKKF